MRKSLILCALLGSVAFMLPASALDRGKVSQTDPRVFIFSYDPEQVYQVRASFGFVTQIRFGADELVQSVTAGDSEGWDIVTPASKSYVSVKPIVRPLLPTNMIVTTTQRSYRFELVEGVRNTGRSDTMMIAARFDYPSTLNSIDALGRALNDVDDLETTLARERRESEAALAEYQAVIDDYTLGQQELAAERGRLELERRIATLEAELMSTSSAFQTTQADRNALEAELAALRQVKERQVYDVLTTRLSEAESARDGAIGRIGSLEQELRDRDDAVQAHERARMAREEARTRADTARREREAALRVARLERDLDQQRSARAGLAAELSARRAADARRIRSTVVFDAFGAGATSTRPGTIDPGSLDRREGDRAFLDDAASRQFETAMAVRIVDLDAKVLQGTMLAGTLETAIDTQLSGMVRATLSEPMWSADGERILAERGSRLVGEYRSFVEFGHDRVLIAWNRLIALDGVSVSLGSPGTDGLGRAGLEGVADTRFLERFGAALLISAISTGSDVLVASAYENDGDVIVAGGYESAGDDAKDATSQLLEPYLDLPTTVHVDQGASIRVFVARDLDFTTTR